MPIKIDFLANVRDFLRGTDSVDDALDDVADALDDVVRDGDKAERDLERSFRDIARAASDSGDKIGKGFDDGLDKAKRGMNDLKSESSSTAREAAASFDGSAESIGDAIQEVTANAFGGFGPAGEIAGLAAAAGIGLAIAAFEGVDEAAEISEENAAEWADAYVAAGSRILSSAQLVERSRAIIADPEQYKAAKKNAEDWGVSESAAILAMAGNKDAINEVRSSLEAQRKARSQLTQEDIRAYAATAEGRDEIAKLEAQLRDGTSSFEKMTGEMEAGATRADVYSESLRLIAENTAGAKRKTDEFGDSVTELPDGTTVYVDAETGQATTDLEAIENKIYGVPTSRDVWINVRARDQTQAELDRIVARINARRAELGVNVYGIGGRSAI